MKIIKSLLISLAIFAVLVTFLGPVVYYPCWYACYGIDWCLGQLSSAIGVWWIGWIFDAIGAIFGLLSSVFKFLYLNWGIFAWLGILV